MQKIALVTGATSGFGKAIAEKFAAAGYGVIVTGRRKERLDELVVELDQKYHAETLALCFDVRDKTAVDQSLGQLPQKWQSVTVLVNNAGLALGREHFDEAGINDWEVMIDTNLKGLVYTTRAVLPFLKKTRGTIINIGSIAGRQVYEKGNMYCATKHAVAAISRGMRIDLLQHGIRVTAIHPGAAETEFSLVRLKGNAAQASQVYEGYQPLEATDIADAAFYCASLPAHVCINEMDITCTAQADAFYTFKG